MGIELSSSAPSVQFENIGDTVTGIILEADEVQQTNLNTGEPVFWDTAKTKPKKMPVLKLDAPRHPAANDDGHVSLFLSGHRYTAVRNVTKRLDEGATITLTFVAYSDREPATRGHNPAKLYRAEYTPAPKGIALDGGPAAPVPQAPSQAYHVPAAAHHSAGAPPF